MSETSSVTAERPPAGVGHYLRDIVYGATDGVVTTLAVVAGVTGAAFDPRVGLVLGLANLAADGLSMGASNYLGMKAELEQTGQSVAAEKPWLHGSATVVAFVCAGGLPLLAYVLAGRLEWPQFGASVVVALLTLAAVGVARAGFVKKSAFRCALEVVSVAGAASSVAYLLGILVESLTQ